jgi:hypothetical protein
MVARTRSYHGELVVVFSRDGDEDDARIAPNGERAAVTAVMLIATRGTLQAGDQLIVRRYGEEGRHDG